MFLKAKSKKGFWKKKHTLSCDSAFCQSILNLEFRIPNQPVSLSLGIPRIFFGCIFWVYTGFTLGIPLIYFGYTLGILGDYFGYTWGTLCRYAISILYSGYTPLIYFGYTLGILGDYFGYTWGTLCRYAISILYSGYTWSILRVYSGYAIGILWLIF